MQIFIFVAMNVAWLIAARSLYLYGRGIGYDTGFDAGFSKGRVDPRDPKTGQYVKRKK